MQKLYAGWCAFCFLAVFLLFFPLFWLFLQYKPWHVYAHRLNRLWGFVFFGLCGIRFDFDYRFVPEKNKTYVFISNHTSYVDIAVLGVLLNTFFVFIGKKSLTKVPLFGYLFGTLHLTVDRNDPESGFKTYQRSLEFISEGRSMMVFIEGGIKTRNPPFLHLPLKDGAFRMAIEKQVPIVPITFPFNWLIMPDLKKFTFRNHVLQATLHPPIETIGLTLADVDALMHKTQILMNAEFEKYYPHHNQPIEQNSLSEKK